MVRVGYLGPEGTFTSLVVAAFLGEQARLVPYPSLWSLNQAFEGQDVDWIVIPEENSIGGMVKEALDIVRYPDREIVAQWIRPIRHAWMIHPDSDGITTVYGHAQALHQCALWLAQHYPEATQCAQASNALAAQQASLTPGAAAVGHPGLAQRWGLKVAAYPIQDREDNTTKFWVLAHQNSHAKSQLEAWGKTHPTAKSLGMQSTWMMSIHDRPGALYHALEPLAQEGVQLSRIESRPSQGGVSPGLWRYDFFLDVVGTRAMAAVDRAYRRLVDEHPVVRVLGEYSTWLLLDDNEAMSIRYT